MTPMVHVRTFTLQTLAGYTIGFEGPNNPVMVPDEVVAEAMAAGAATVGEVGLQDFSGVVADRLEKAAAEPTGEERDVQVRAVMRDLLGINNAADFDANGTPKVHAVNAQLPFKITAEERNARWQEVQLELADE